MRIVFTTDEDAVVVEDETEAPPAGIRAAKVEEESIMGTPPAAVGEDDEECVASTPPPPGVLVVAGLVGNILCKAMECVLVAASLLLICGRRSTKQYMVQLRKSRTKQGDGESRSVFGGLVVSRLCLLFCVCLERMRNSQVSFVCQRPFCR